MGNILLFDTSIASKNLGDEIILHSVKENLSYIFPKERLLNTPTHEIISNSTYKLNKISHLSFVAGTNLLASNMNKVRQWKINYYNSLFIKNLILFGVGWWQYQNAPNLYTKVLLRRLLSKKFIHSVRDSYTELKLKSLGIKNVINTGCPTTWKLSEDHCKQIPRDKSDSVVFTITDYNPDVKSDRFLIDSLKKSYKNIYFWPQGAGDLQYLKRFDTNKIKILSQSLEGFDLLLKSKEDIEYIGTRLHAGIRALSFKRKSLIVGIDNRSKEISKDINLPMIDRTEIRNLNEIITKNLKTNIKLNYLGIEKWKNQFLEI